MRMAGMEADQLNGCKAIILLLAAVVAWTGFYGYAAAETAAPPSRSLSVRRTTAPVEIDGRLDEADWSACDSFKLAGYKDGAEPQQSTECRLMWDDTYLYISWKCVDADIWGTLTGRDDPLYNEEVAEAFFNPDGDTETYLELEISPRGTLWDGNIRRSSSGRSVDLAWNSLLLKSAVSVEGTVNQPGDKDSCWTVELAMPFAELADAPHTPPQEGDSWRLNLYRIDLPERNTKLAEYSAWSPVSGDTFHDPDRFGEIIFSGSPVRALRGDTNEDGKINIFDLLNLLRALSDPESQPVDSANDVDENGKLNIFDLLMLLNIFKDQTF
ncbi:MAG: hypothetical protein A3F83_16995 [Candidatus Glassbacteria bacterium RIFCSPLOWO2_12_FULL_58_11]|uniref:Dockerin domain-containing protein n=2 Tax=Candidatus Glassiibacteriota TaxID=1817805 RepID=A0A1F5YLL2_9BACT|nr:MAG: hypothetical protein A2Z86_03610 [Candidatus Glassbacteria bacterium GWA2_58_10]OGG01070.1 MAG: hypothetical protein A3F83_16995 [Candidatus Glassbacteria bacterium RIFCSPLOWO2_12_FULL_58_11]